MQPHTHTNQPTPALCNTHHNTAHTATYIPDPSLSSSTASLDADPKPLRPLRQGRCLQQLTHHIIHRVRHTVCVCHLHNVMKITSPHTNHTSALPHMQPRHTPHPHPHTTQHHTAPLNALRHAPARFRLVKLDSFARGGPTLAAPAAPRPNSDATHTFCQCMAFATG